MVVFLANRHILQLFDQRASQNKVADSASKESTVQQAGAMAIKMYLKSQGGSGSHQPTSAGNIMDMASKFLK
jgi:hypothetical protein